MATILEKSVEVADAVKTAKAMATETRKTVRVFRHYENNVPGCLILTVGDEPRPDDCVKIGFHSPQ